MMAVQPHGPITFQVRCAGQFVGPQILGYKLEVESALDMQLAYVELRKEFQHLFEGADAVKQVMDTDENCLAKFIRACYDRRSTLLDQACSKRGGRPPA